MKNVRSFLTLLAAAAFVLGGAPAMRAAYTVPEPETIFYGRIINRLTGQTFQLSAGTLTWSIRRANGSLLTLNAELQPLNGGVYSYRLNVPHQALSLGLTVTGTAVPLGAQPTVCVHEQISVDGYPATILAPGSSSFTVSQATRAGAYRLDLEVTSPLFDLDEDGIPDWWAERYLVLSPTEDPDGDGRNNLAEFLEGSDPNRDDRAPSLATTELLAYADGTTAVLLRGIDSDSMPSNLVYTLVSAPENVTLVRRNSTVGGASHDTALTNGATFTQADVNAGRLVLTHQNESTAPGLFQVLLADETTNHPAFTGTVSIAFYRPAHAPSAADVSMAVTAPSRLPKLAGLTAGEEPMAVGYTLSKEMGFVVCDSAGEAMGRTLAAPSSGLTPAAYQSQYVPSYGADKHHLFLGGAGSDRISGGMEGDILIGGRGRDTLRGNGGADLFVICQATDGNDIIEDFNAGEGDVLDLSRVLVGASPWLTNYVQPALSGTNTLLRLNFAGTGAPYSDMSLQLTGVRLSQATFLALAESGQIYTGGKGVAPRVTLVASQPAASENGPMPGEFTLTRSGSLEAALTVNLQLTGSAVNGTDYTYVNPQATFLPGNRSLTVQIQPFADAVTELAEVVDLTILPGANYEPGSNATARVTIEDLAPQITIEAIEPIAVKSDLTPGVMLVSRAGVLDRSVLVRLAISGTASGTTDYQGVPTFINLQAGQATALIYVTPRTTAVISGGAEFVQVSIRPDPAYRVEQPSQARVTLVEERISFPLWRERFFAGVPGDLETFAQGDLGLTGIPHFQRYAFGLDPAAPQTSPGRPLYQFRDGHLTVQFRHPASLPDVQYAIEVSEDLVTWQAGDSYVRPFAAPELALLPEYSAYRIEQPISATRTMFMRVRPIYVP